MKSAARKPTAPRPRAKCLSRLTRAFAEGTGPVTLYTSQMRANLAEVLAHVSATGRPVIVRKKGSQDELARIVPPSKPAVRFFGCMADETTILGSDEELFSARESRETSTSDPLRASR